MTAHEILPVKGSAVREGIDVRANLLNPTDYPVLAICQECDQMIRCEHWFHGEWEHVTVAA